jgi:hypothetical protein
MLDQIARHGLIDLDIQAKGDLHIDGHHTVEDVGITLGQAVYQGRGRQEGHPPLRPRLRAAGRGAVARGDRLFRPAGLVMNVPFKSGMIGTFDTQLAHEFFQGFCNHAFVTLHIDNLRAKTPTTSAKRCSRPSPGRCAWRWRSTRAPAGDHPVHEGQPLSPYGRRGRLRHGQPALGVAGGAARGAGQRLRGDRHLPPRRRAGRRARRAARPGRHADCMRELRESGLLESVLEAAASKPLFGVCVGMQMLLDRSEEGPTDGLGLIPARSSVSSWKASCSPMAAATRCRKWAGTRCARRSRTRCGRACRTAATSISCTAFTPGRRTRAPQRRGIRLRRALYRGRGPR